MPYFLVLGSEGHPFHAGKAIVTNARGHHFSKDPIPIERAKRQMRLLESLAKKESK